MNVAYHESLEMALVRLSVRYQKTQQQSGDTGKFYFFFDHATFTEAVAQATEFCENIRPHLKRLWKKQRTTDKAES